MALKTHDLAREAVGYSGVFGASAVIDRSETIDTV
jgi:hypothetical protein